MTQLALPASLERYSLRRDEAPDGSWRYATIQRFTDGFERVIETHLRKGAAVDFGKKLAADNGVPFYDEDDSDAFYTDPVLAARIVTWANIIPGGRWLEPSAGSGVFVRPMVEAGAIVTACERDRGERERLLELSKQYDRKLSIVSGGDFMQYPAHSGYFDGAIMNPPYSNGRDGLHVAHALAMSKRVVCLVRTNFVNGADRFEQVWKRHYISRRIHFVDRPNFDGPSDEGHGARHEFTVLEIKPRTNGSAGTVCVDYWWRAKARRKGKKS